MKNSIHCGQSVAFSNMNKNSMKHTQSNDRSEHYKPMISPQDGMRTEFKKLFSIAMRTKKYDEILKHVEERLMYNKIDQGKSVNNKLISTILNIYSKANQFDKALELFYSIKEKRNPFYKHINLDIYHYQIMLDACCNVSAKTREKHQNSLDKSIVPIHIIATNILYDMINKSKNVQIHTNHQNYKFKKHTLTGKKNLTPNALNFTSVILTCIKCKEYELGYKLFLIARDELHIVPDTMLCNAILSCMSHLSANENNSYGITQEHVLDFFNNMEGKPARNTTMLLEEKANAPSNNVDNESLSPEVVRDSYTYGVMVKHFMKRGDLKAVKLYLNEANKQMLVNFGLVQLVMDATLKSRDHEEATSLLHLCEGYNAQLIHKKSIALPSYITPNKAMLSNDEEGGSDRLRKTQLLEQSLNPKKLKYSSSVTTKVSTHSTDAASLQLQSKLLADGDIHSNENVTVLNNDTKKFMSLMDEPEGSVDAMDMNGSSDIAHANHTVNTEMIGTTVLNSSVSIINNSNQLIRRATHNLAGTTNNQMLNITPITSYNATFYTYANVPIVNQRARRLLNKTNHTEHDVNKSIVINNAKTSLKLYEDMKLEGLPILKSHLINMMLAIEKDYIIKGTGDEYTYDMVINSKRDHLIDQIYKDGLVLKHFKPLTLTKIVKEKNNIDFIRNSSYKCNVRRNCTHVDVVRRASLRHFMNNELTKLSEIKNNFLFIVGNEYKDTHTSLYEVCRDVLASIEPMGILEVIEENEHRRVNKGRVVVSASSLQMWLDTKKLLVQAHEEVLDFDSGAEATNTKVVDDVN